ncbi:MAG: arylesterase [Gammaproteobacteria bacterium]|nr:MAG: arylesterase [Gammaproteobacteria bacterium]
MTLPVRRRLLGIGLGLLLLAGCGGGPELAELASDATILAFGDSLTAGTGAKRTDAYPAVLDTLLSQNVVNAGVPGETTAGGLARLPDALAAHRPALVILCLGGNDMLRKLDRGKAKANLAAMIRLVQESGAQIVLLGIPEPGLLLLSAPAFYTELADEFGIPFEDEALPRIISDRSLKSDPIHPNAEGYRQLAEEVRALLVATGAVE